MYYPQNKIIIVDNRVDHLDELSKPFYDNGIGCKTYQYDAQFVEPLNGVRVAFFDINLNDLTNPEQKSSQIYSTLADAIRLYIHSENGPFALIFWTSNRTLIEGFIEFINDRGEKIPAPFLINYIDKDEFIESTNNLEEKLAEILNDEIIKLLFDFESNAAKAAAITINQVYDIIPTNDSWGSTINFKENFEKIFSKIAESTFGLSHAKNYPTKAVYSALIPMLNYFIRENANDETWRNILVSLNDASKSADLTFPNNFDFRRLNTVFHTERSQKNDKGERGAVIKHPVEVESYTYPFSDYFRRLEEESKRMFDLFLTFNSDNTTNEERDHVRSNAQFVFVEISASCDYSQNKKRINKYILGLMTPIIDPEKILNPSDAVFSLPDIVFNDKSYQFRLNFNYVYGLTPNDSKLDDLLFVLKGTIVDQVGNRYANHISRIGITSFN